MLILAFSLLIFSLQLKKELDVSEKTLERTIYSWGTYIDSCQVRSKADQDTIRELRLELTKRNSTPLLGKKNKLATQS